MTTIETLIEAINQRKSISFEYNKEGSANGLRFGNPHAVFLASTDEVNIHIWKTGGVNTDPKKLPPIWKTYSVKNLENITIIQDTKKFDIAIDYKPNSPMYTKAIAKV